MLPFFLIACLLTFSQGQSFPRALTNRLKTPEEYNVDDITFTTSSPNYAKSSSHKPIKYYNAIKHDYGNKGLTLHTKNPNKIIKPYTKTTFADGTASMSSADEIYITEKPKTSSTFRHKPMRLYDNDQKTRDGYGPSVYLTKSNERVTPMHFQQATSNIVLSPKTSPRRYAAKIVPFSNYSPSSSHSKTPAEDTYPQKEKHGFIPAITTSKISGTDYSEISGGVLTTFPGIKETVTHTFHSEPIKFTDHSEGAKTSYYSQEAKLEEEPQSSLATQDFYTTSGNYGENDDSPKDSFHENESVLSESSTPQNDKGEINLEKVADSVENMKTGERVEFQMYGMDGPKSYKFGFDTGKGQNRHFRFEERDKSGKVKGHYGYIDEEGKMRIMKYEADPLTGFRAGPVEVTEDES